MTEIFDTQVPQISAVVLLTSQPWPLTARQKILRMISVLLGKIRENMVLYQIVYQTSFLNLVKPHDIYTTNAFIHARFLKLSVDPLTRASEGVEIGRDGVK